MPMRVGRGPLDRDTVCCAGDTDRVVDWSGIDRERFERAVQMLVRDVFGATSIDGAGGDLAQDLRWDSPEGLVIFEIKSFDKRLASSQKKQIQRSLKRCVELHAPARWILITRSNPRAQELAWLQQQTADLPGVVLEWFGRDWLDRQVAGREDVIAYMEGEDYKLLRRARSLELERAAGATGTDLLSRHEQLRQLGNDISPYWRWDVSSGPDGIMRVLSAKRPESVTIDPIALKPMFHLPAEDAEAARLAEQLSQTLAVGGDVTVPGRYLDKFEIEAASEATQRLFAPDPQPPDSLRIVSVPSSEGLPLALTLHVERGGQRTGHSLDLAITQQLTGAEGRTLLGHDRSQLLKVRMVLPDEGSQVQGKLTLDMQSVHGRRPHEVEPAITWLCQLTDAESLALTAGPLHIGRFHGGAGWPQDLTALHMLIRALVVLQDHLGTLLPVPAQLPNAPQLREILDVAQALSGTPVKQRFDGIDATVHRGKLRPFLDAIPTEPGGIYITNVLAIELDGQPIEVPGVALWAPNMQLENRAELEAISLDVTKHQVRFRSAPDADIYLTRAVAEPGAPWTAVPT